MRKEIKLTRGYSAFVDEEDYERVSIFRWLVVGKGNHLYAGRYVNKDGTTKAILMHRFILDVNDRLICVDHKDGNGLNNCKDNIRVASHQENNKNRKPSRNGTSKYLGVSKYNNKWVAQIRENKIKKHLGFFTNEEEAAKAYDKKAKEIHGEFANLNFK